MHLGKSHFIQYHHIFPEAKLKGKYDKTMIDEIANMTFIGATSNTWMIENF
jgi:hypothetical protein